MIKMTNLYTGDVINANEQTIFGDCSLNVNFWKFLLISFCFMMKKDYFKQ